MPAVRTATRRRSVAQAVAIVGALLAVPLAVLWVATGELPLTGIIVSSPLLFAAVWLTTPPNPAQR